MASPRTEVYTKNAKLSLFLGDLSARTLWIKPGWAVGFIHASIAPNGTSGVDTRAVARLSLQSFSGAKPDGAGGWTGGAWTTFWSIVLDSFNASTASTVLKSYKAGSFMAEFDPPMVIAGFQSSIKTGDDHARKGGFVSPNTHNSVEVNGEWDIRAFFTEVATESTAAGFDCDVNVGMLTSEGGGS